MAKKTLDPLAFKNILKTLNSFKNSQNGVISESQLTDAFAEYDVTDDQMTNIRAYLNTQDISIAKDAPVAAPSSPASASRSAVSISRSAATVSGSDIKVSKAFTSAPEINGTATAASIRSTTDIKNDSVSSIDNMDPDDEFSDDEEMTDEDIIDDEAFSEDDLSDEDKDARNINIDTLKSIESISTDDPVRIYLKQIGIYPLLSKEEEYSLACRSRDGDTFAKSRLVESNLRLVVSVAKHYVGRGMSFLDLIQEGNLGLMHGIDKFDPDKGFKLSTYVTWWIKQSIIRSLADHSRTIRVPVHVVELINKTKRISREMSLELGHEPSLEELADRMDLTPDRIAEILSYDNSLTSLDSKVGDDEDSELSNFVKDDKLISPEQNANHVMMREELDKTLSILTDKEKTVIEYRYGLIDGQERTLEEIGQMYGLTRERIRQIESKAIRKLQNPKYKRMLTGFLED